MTLDNHWSTALQYAATGQPFWSLGRGALHTATGDIVYCLRCFTQMQREIHTLWWTCVRFIRRDAQPVSIPFVKWSLNFMPQIEYIITLTLHNDATTIHMITWSHDHMTTVNVIMCTRQVQSAVPLVHFDMNIYNLKEIFIIFRKHHILLKKISVLYFFVRRVPLFYGFKSHWSCI